MNSVAAGFIAWKAPDFLVFCTVFVDYPRLHRIENATRLRAGYRLVGNAGGGYCLTGKNRRG